jgi:polyhydroxyalkanoate synthase
MSLPLRYLTDTFDNVRNLLGQRTPPSPRNGNGPDQVKADELHYATTQDGLKIALWRYQPESGEGIDSDPVILVHGLGSNNRTLALDEEFGVAQYLARRGFDCWAVDLRGRGASDVPASNWTFDAYAKQDLPATIEYILEKTGRPALHWVGHSMGGMLYFALAGALEYDNQIASGTALASPIDFPEPRLVERIGSILHGLPFATRVKTSKAVVQVLLSGLRLAPRAIVEYLYNPANVDPDVLVRAANQAFAGTSSKVMTQFPEWFVKDQWMDTRRRIDYRAGIRTIDVPTQVIAGAVDRLSPPQHVKSGYEDLETSEKRFIIAGEISGYRHDYSHIDLLFGKRVRGEIFPLVADWVRRHPVDETD